MNLDNAAIFPPPGNRRWCGRAHRPGNRPGASVRTAGRLLNVGAVSGIIHEAGDDVSPKIDGGFPDATETQMTSFDRALARREVERDERIDAKPLRRKTP